MLAIAQMVSSGVGVGISISIVPPRNKKTGKRVDGSPVFADEVTFDCPKLVRFPGEYFFPGCWTAKA